MTTTQATTATQDLTTLTPTEIDTQIANLDEAWWALSDRLGHRDSTAHYVAQDTRNRGGSWGRGPTWTMSDREAWAKVEAMAAAGDTSRNYQLAACPTAAELIATRDGLRAEQAANRTAVAPFHTEYHRRGGWTRYYLVTSSAGHVHANTYCSHRGRTQYGWLPQVSGMAVDAMIEDIGPTMCTKCYPDAPTAGTKKVTKAQAANRSAGRVATA